MNLNHIAFIGLGVMGYPMAGHLAQHGFNVRVYNRTTAKSIHWVDAHQGTYHASPSAAAQGCEVVALCVGNDDDVRSVVYGEHGVLTSMQPGSILIDHTTTSAELAEELAQACLKQGVSFIDAPVSGGESGAINGTLTIMCGGDATVFQAVAPVFSTYANNQVLLGACGQGQRCKMVNQVCIAGVLKGLSEAVLLAEQAKLNITDVVKVLKHGAAGSWQMENRAESMLNREFDFGFAIDWMLKDLGICLHEAQKYGLDLALTKTVAHDYQVLQQNNMGRKDTSALIESYLSTP